MKLLLVSSRFPWPSWRGNQVRTVQWLEALSDHERLLVCPTGDRENREVRPGLEVRAFPRGRIEIATGLAAAVVGGRPAQEGIYAISGARRLVAELVDRWRPDAVVIQMVRCGWAADSVHRAAPDLPLLFDAIDCMALHYRRAATAVPAVLRPLYRMEAERCRKREGGLVRSARITTAVSHRDLEALDAGERGRVVVVGGGMKPVSNDVSTDEPVVLLSGNLGYRPTIRAARWFADRVWPRLHALVPEATWILAGARPAAAVKRLASRTGVEVHGDVDDMGAFLNRARVAVAPMASGSGVPIKILEAMAARVPVVADPWSADGLEDPSAVVEARGAEAWINALHRLLTDPGAAQAQASAGERVWREHYESSRVAAVIRGAVAIAAGGDG
jgi:glycosyltransferase involved in cell wall biosynthesis